MSDWRTLHGVGVGVGPECDVTLEDTVFGKLDAALGLLDTYDPRVVERMRRDALRVWVKRNAYATAHYSEYWRMCLVDVKFAAHPETTPAKLAAIIVHEVTHARLLKCGIPYAESARHRIEDICVAQSAMFARRLPDGEALARELETWQPTDSTQWADATLQLRLLAARLQELDEAPVPNWLKRILCRRILSRAPLTPDQRAQLGMPALRR
jgi:hypothetical protein